MGLKKDIKDFNPFPGLRPFAPQDCELFFGRETETDEVILKLLNNRFATVIGTSGNGKSSLIFSGILPKILQTKINQSAQWKMISFRPGNDPFGNIASAISAEITDTDQRNINRDEILSELLTESVSFSDVVRKHMIKNDENILLIIDQFDDLFRYIKPGKSESANGDAKKFVDFILNSVGKSDKNLFIIIGMRSEYLGACSNFKGLTMLVNSSNYLIPDMGIENYRDVIQRSVNSTGAKIEPQLVDNLLADIKGTIQPLSVLQHALMRTWAHWHGMDQPDRPISREDYSLIGTMSNAIALHAEETYEELNQRGKDICAAMFKVLTRRDLDNKCLSHPSDIETIKSIAECSNDEIFLVADKFRGTTRSFIIPSADFTLNEKSVIDLQNDCLLRYWKRLKEWVDNEIASRETYLRLSEASALYQQGKAGLLRSPDLEPVIQWRNQNKPTLGWAVQYNPAFERAMVYLRTREKSFLI